MDNEERIKVLEEEFQTTKLELQQILLDIRTFQMEGQTPLPAETKRGKVQAQRGAKKGVAKDGDR
ncbi:hypothetical protein ACFLV1_02080 [Chloroflexota bacterium]